MTVDHEDDLEALRRAGAAVAAARDAMLDAVAPGVSTADLDAVGRAVLDAHGARPAPPTVGFPAATCVSVNDEVAHGIPSTRRRLPTATSSTSTCRPSSTATGPTPERARRSDARPCGPASCSTPPGWPTATPSPRRAPAGRSATSAAPCSAAPAGTASR